MGPVLKLNLYFFQVAGPMNSAHGPTKKNAVVGKCTKCSSQTHTKNLQKFIAIGLKCFNSACAHTHREK